MFYYIGCVLYRDVKYAQHMYIYIPTAYIIDVCVYIKQHMCVCQPFIQVYWFHEGRNFFLTIAAAPMSIHGS